MVEALIVFGILAAVAFAAVMYEAPDPYGPWLKLAASYAATDSPETVDFTEQTILFGGLTGRMKPLGDGKRFDISLDDEGLWLTIRRAPLKGTATTLKIPGSHIRFRDRSGGEYVFELFARPPIKVSLQGDAGKAIYDRLQEGSAGA